MNNDQLVQANGVALCLEAFGDSANAAILLIAGAGSSMLSWEGEFCERLAAGSRFVIRYDNRDTGRSVSYEPGVPPYTLRDLVADAVGLLDTLGLARAHLVGMSQGAAIAQLVAIDYPDRVTSITLACDAWWSRTRKSRPSANVRGARGLLHARGGGTRLVGSNGGD
jgi:pimeloyl-ACP methyl ester carboxylesterase